MLEIAEQIVQDQLLLQPLLTLRDDAEVEVHGKSTNLKHDSMLEDKTSEASSLLNVYKFCNFAKQIYTFFLLRCL